MQTGEYSQAQAEYEAAGAKLTYTAFIAKATIDTIRQFPFSNASIDGDNIAEVKFDALNPQGVYTRAGATCSTMCRPSAR